MTTPAMNDPLVAKPNPTSFDLGPFGPVYMTGAISGLGLWQNNISPGDQHSLASLSYGQFFFQKPEGLFKLNIFWKRAPIRYRPSARPTSTLLRRRATISGRCRSPI
jgi:hypothetical protein